MRLTLLIDNIAHQIDSTDPDLLSRWIMEIFGRIPQIYEATDIRMQVYPSFLPDGNGSWAPDWAADTRVIGQVTPIRSPRELLSVLGQQLDDLEAL